MRTNEDITLFLFSKDGNQKTYTRIPVYEVFWDSVDSATLLKTGQKSAVTVQLVIPYESLWEPISFSPMNDYVVRGIVEDEIDASTDKALAESLAALRSKHKYCTIVTADPKLYGSESMWHYELTCN